MSDLNDFFAKKDRKKKRAGLKSAQAAATVEAPKVDQVPVETIPVPPPKQPDDGWIEIDDPRGAQVNTGGRTVVEFKRDVEDKELINEGHDDSEKFSGWIKSQAQQNQENATDKPTAPTSAGTAFPTLADAANAPKVPVSRPRTASKTASSYAAAGRPRFTNSKLANRAQTSSK